MSNDQKDTEVTSKSPETPEEDEQSNEQLQSEDQLDGLAEEFERLPLDSSDTSIPQLSDEFATEDALPEDTTLYDDPSDEDDGQGEWITPTNVSLHKSRALDLLPDAANQNSKKKAAQAEPVIVGCMTADYAMQNVLLHMGLNLVGVEGTRISSVKSWVLRCHACFKCASPFFREVDTDLIIIEYAKTLLKSSAHPAETLRS